MIREVLLDASALNTNKRRRRDEREGASDKEARVTRDVGARCVTGNAGEVDRL